MLKQLRGHAARKGVSSIIIGLGSCVAIYGGHYNRTSRIYKATDADLIKSDWLAVGSDLRRAADTLINKG